VKQVEYVQMIMGPNPLVIGLCNDSDKVFSKLLYATPLYSFSRKLVYTTQDLEVLKMTTEEWGHTDHMIQHLGDPSLTVEVH